MVAKTYWLAGSALALLVAAGPAMAADLPVAPVYKAPPPMIAPLNWTGFYLGAGTGFAVFNADTSVQSPAGVRLERRDNDPAALEPAAFDALLRAVGVAG